MQAIRIRDSHAFRQLLWPGAAGCSCKRMASNNALHRPSACLYQGSCSSHRHLRSLNHAKRRRIVTVRKVPSTTREPKHREDKNKYATVLRDRPHSLPGPFFSNGEFDESIFSSADGAEESALALPLYNEKYVSHLKDHFSRLKSYALVNQEHRETARKQFRRQRLWTDNAEQTEEGKLSAAQETSFPWAYTENKHKVRGDDVGLRQQFEAKKLEAFANTREATREELWRCTKVIRALHELSNANPRSDAEQDKIIYVPETALVRMFSSELENKVGFKLGSGCTLHVLGKRMRGEEGHREVALTGSPIAVELAEKQIADAVEKERFRKHLAPFSRYHALSPSSSTPSNNPPIRAVWSNVRYHNYVSPRDVHRRRPVDVPRPSEWTTKTLADYLEDLVSCHLPESQLRQYYSGYNEFYDAIADMVFNVLSHPSTQRLVSSRVVHVVVRFFVKHQRLSKLNKVVMLLSDFMTTRSFNRLLAAAAQRRDLLLFQTYINMMRKQGLRPNGFEVVQFLKCIVSHKIRSYMLLHLHQRGFLSDPHVRKAAISCSLQDSFLFHMTTGQSVSEYIAALDKMFGSNWINTDAINRMVLEASYARNPEAIADILDYCKRNGIDLDPRTMTYGLMYFTEAKRFKAGIKFFLHMNRVHNVRRKDPTTQMLFILAWKRRAYNVCRVVWRYACLEGCANMAMQGLVLSSIVRNTPSEPTTNSEFWFLRAGKVIAGIETDLMNNNNLSQEPSFFHEHRIDPKLVGHTDPSGGRGSQLTHAKATVTKDLQAYENFEPLEPLENLIERAMELDIEWGKMQKPVEWIFENAIRVPVVRRRGRRTTVPSNQRRQNIETSHYGEIGEDGYPSDIGSIFFDNSILERRIHD